MSSIRNNCSFYMMGLCVEEVISSLWVGLKNPIRNEIVQESLYDLFKALLLLVLLLLISLFSMLDIQKQSEQPFGHEGQFF